MRGIIAAALLFGPAGPAAAEEAPKVAIAVIEASGRYARDMAVFSTALKERLEACGRFEVLDRQDVDGAADAMRLRKPFKPKDLARLGRTLEAELVLAGRMFTNAGEGWDLSMSVVDAKTGKQRWLLKVKCDGCAAENAGVDTMMGRKMAEELVGKRLGKGRGCPTQP